MNTITCPNCHHEFELNNALTHDIEERIRKENAEELQALRLKANEVEELQAKQEELLVDARHQVKLEMSKQLTEEKSKLYSEIEQLEKVQSTAEEIKNQAVQEAIKEAKTNALKESESLFSKRMEEVKAQVLQEQQAEVSNMQMQLQLAQENTTQQQQNFQEMLKQQQKQFEDQKKQQADFSAQQLAQQKEIFERDVAKREHELVAKVKLESELKLKEQEEMLRTMKAQINSMKETADKKSQQLQGEALEVLIEERLMRDTAFRLDSFTEVKKGANGVDVNMTVQNQLGESCGLIMIEAKRAANWSDGWIKKIKADRIEAGVKEAVCLIVSTRLKQDDILVDDLGDGIWAAAPEYFIHFIQIIRKNMEDMHRVQKSNIDRGDKKELLYSYVNSDAFRSKVLAMNEYQENIYSQGVKIQRNMKKMLDTIVKNRDVADDLFIELGNSAEVNLLPELEDEGEIIKIETNAHKDKNLLS